MNVYLEIGVMEQERSSLKNEVDVPIDLSGIQTRKSLSTVFEVFLCEDSIKSLLHIHRPKC